MTQNWNAFVNEEWTLSHHSAKGQLSGLTFGVKDVFALEGYTSSAGNPDWLRTHSPAEQTAPAIRKLLEAGAELRGTTHTDELMYSLNGQNVHYGTPVNPQAPDRIPGGSSSGSAVAVSAGLRDFAIGTDTGGSVRIPSSYCGIYGIRPTHGLVDIHGVIPLAQGFDTVGWMANSADVLYRVGQALLQDVAAAAQPHSGDSFDIVYWPQEAWAGAEAETSELLRQVAERLLSGASSQEGAVKQEQIAIAPEGLAAWMTAFRTVQGIEIWEQHQQWIEEVQPTFADDIAGRFQWASTLQREQSGEAFALMNEVRDRLHQLLGNNGLLILPTATGPAPAVHIEGEANEQRRSRTMQLSCIAGLSGLPQVSIPAGLIEGAPVGLSVIAGPGQDLRLLDWVRQTSQALTLR
ncbi:amidase [Paenibacillus sp. WLX2291]|uniref:amidase n=1 Tax=Paenibacillus sp. WLX2291 TaxID=3296934 RepID=UPI0039841B47